VSTERELKDNDRMDVAGTVLLFRANPKRKASPGTEG
jgi:hypothetical protein